MSKGGIGATIIAVIMAIAIVIICMCVCQVPAGYVAVQYNMNGGIRDEVLTQGWHLVPITVHTTNYTVGLEQSYLTASSKGDSRDDESFTASSSEGKALTLELTFTYQFDPDTVTDVFVRFKGQSGQEVRDSFIKPNIISWTKEVVATYKVADIIGAERANINVALTEYLSKKFAPYNITISNVSLINIEVDADTQRVINEKIAAQQNAETQAINNQMAIDKAEAEAKVMLTKAQAEADALVVAAEAQAEANKKIQQSLTEGVLQSQWIEKWNGVLPQFTGGNVLFGLDGVIH